MSNLDISIKSKPIRDNKTGRILDDAEFVNVALDTLEKYKQNTGRPAPVAPIFVNWLEQTKERLDAGEKITDIKADSIVRLIPDYSQLF